MAAVFEHTYCLKCGTTKAFVLIPAALKHPASIFVRTLHPLSKNPHMVYEPNNLSTRRFVLSFFHVNQPTS